MQLTCYLNLRHLYLYFISLQRGKKYLEVLTTSTMNGGMEEGKREAESFGEVKSHPLLLSEIFLPLNRIFGTSRNNTCLTP